MKVKVYSLKELLILNIKYYRYLNNYSQEILAEKANLSTRYVTDIERSKHVPSMDKLERIAKALNVEPYILFMDIDRDKDIIKRMQDGRQYNQSLK